MGSTKNINKKLLIAMFTALSLIGFIYSVYSQATSAQNNAVSSLESNSIIQWIINSSISGYSTAGQSLASFLSIKAIPSYVWTIITFLITTLFFIGIYTFLFEIFIQRVGIKENENETMKKAKILFIFTLSVFSALAIGYAIPFLLNLYGLILLILVIITLFFFGRATISYGKSFHYATKSFEADVKKDYLEIAGELEKLENEKNLSKEDVMNISELLGVIKEDYRLYQDAENKFKNILSNIREERETFFNNLISSYDSYLNSNNIRNNLIIENQKQQLDDFFKKIENEKNREIKNRQKLQKIRSMKKLYDRILNQIKNLKEFNDTDRQIKQEFKNILDRVYNDTVSKYRQKILDEIEEALNEYNRAKALLLQRFFKYETKFKRKITSGVRKFLGVPDNLEKDIQRLINSIESRIEFLKKLEALYQHK